MRVLRNRTASVVWKLKKRNKIAKLKKKIIVFKQIIKNKHKYIKYIDIFIISL